ncbi:MAG: biotin/lipoyl-containing protein, partial [Paracoccaceae bacterium]
LFSAGREHNFTLLDPYHPASARQAEDGQLTAPMPGTVVLVAVTAGQAVAKGDPLVVIEAMKMEHAILAPRSGSIAALRVKPGDRVAMGAELVVMEPAP